MLYRLFLLKPIGPGGVCLGNFHLYSPLRTIRLSFIVITTIVSMFISSCSIKTYFKHPKYYIEYTAKQLNYSKKLGHFEKFKIKNYTSNKN